MNPSEEMATLQQKETDTETEKPEQEAPSFKSSEIIREGDWVEIQDKGIADIFHDGKAKVVLLLKGMVDIHGNPIIKPSTSASLRDRAAYEIQLSQGMREEIRAVLFGLSVDQTRKIELSRTIGTDKLRKIEPQNLPNIKKTPQPPALKTNQNGNFAFREHEKKPKIEEEEEIPKRRRRRGEK